MNFRLKYRLRRFRVWFRKIWAIISLSKKEQYSTDIDLAIKIVKRMLSKPDVDIRHSPIRSVFHVKHGHLYAKISDNSITWASAAEVQEEYGINIHTGKAVPDISTYAAVVLAVSHDEFAALPLKKNSQQVIYDVKGFLDRDLVDARL